MIAVENRYRSLVAEIKLAGKSENAEIAAALCRFGAVLACGFVERSIEAIILDRLMVRADPKILNFVKSHLRRGVNCNSRGIAALLGRFDSAWRKSFEEFLRDHEKEAASLDSIYSVRNNVAHGDSLNVTYHTLKNQIEDVKTIVDAVIQSTSR